MGQNYWKIDRANPYGAGRGRMVSKKNVLLEDSVSSSSGDNMILPKQNEHRDNRKTSSTAPVSLSPKAE